MKSNFNSINSENSGFFNLEETCFDPAHKPPSHIFIPPGKGYRHECPTCKKITDLTPIHIR